MRVESVEELATRLERTADWNGHLRSCERADLRDAASQLRVLESELHRAAADGDPERAPQGVTLHWESALSAKPTNG